MNVRRGRARRPDDWPSSHLRARSDLSDRLDAPLDATEASWLEAHLEACHECRTIAAAYEAQRIELRGLRERMPSPPRDLWARTAAAIESESRFRDGRARSAGWRDHRYLAPSALLAAALVVAVAVGTLTSSQRFGGDGATGSSGAVANGSASPSRVPVSAPGGPTPIPVTTTMAYLSRDVDGGFTIKVRNVDKVCPSTSTKPCDAVATVVDRPVNLGQGAATVFGDPNDARFIVVNDPGSANGGTISVVPLGSAPPDTAESPSVPPTSVA
ncbi:MAG TPA: zf-HC2 domain-containing protein, partial [Candidatus Deferrimicrobium sp.]|nr:zf-HC2 domain-containing protein [Candidatus Deferrimicrobium sp.]